jgi:hypothetical protein
MANMSYCRFENTAQDMKDCLDALEEAGGIIEYMEECDPSDYERRGMKQFFLLVKNAYETYKDEINNLK